MHLFTVYVWNGRMEPLGVNYHACMCPEWYSMPSVWSANIIYVLCCFVRMQILSMCYAAELLPNFQNCAMVLFMLKSTIFRTLLVRLVITNIFFK